MQSSTRAVFAMKTRAEPNGPPTDGNRQTEARTILGKLRDLVLDWKSLTVNGEAPVVFLLT